MRRLLLVLALTLGATAVAVLPVGAGAAPTVSGAVTCNADGSAVITWTFNVFSGFTQIDNPNVVVSGAVTGGATFAPSGVASPGSATATTAVPVGVAGQVIIVVPWQVVKGPSGSATGAVNVACAPTPAESVDASPRTVG